MPAGVASVSMIHVLEGTAYFAYLLLSVSGFSHHSGTSKETHD
jgi:hypothetical protein